MRQAVILKPSHCMTNDCIKITFCLLLIVSLCSNNASADNAFNDMLVLAEQGNAYAQNYVGRAYRTGDIVIQDSANAVEWFKRAAVQGDRNAKYNLAMAYWTGDGIEQDQTAAIPLLIDSAEANHSSASFMLGTIIEEGVWLEKSYTAAMTYYRQAANSDVPEAYFKVAQLHDQGLGTARHYQNAVNNLNKAIALGNDQAKAYQSTMFFRGWSIPKAQD
jgi:TPR repeat protein